MSLEIISWFVYEICIGYITSKGVILFDINIEIRQMMPFEATRLRFAEIRKLHGWIGRVFLSLKNSSIRPTGIVPLVRILKEAGQERLNEP